MYPLKGSKNTPTVHSRPHLVAGVASPSIFAKLEKLRGAQLSGMTPECYQWLLILMGKLNQKVGQ